jgi:hypothetical protein
VVHQQVLADRVKASIIFGIGNQEMSCRILVVGENVFYFPQSVLNQDTYLTVKKQGKTLLWLALTILQGEDSEQSLLLLPLLAVLVK